MPCIRFLRNHTGKIATTYPCSHPISVRMRNGNYQDSRWLAMVCEAAIPHLEFLGSVKIKAMDITNGDGIKCEWRSLKKGEHVLGARGNGRTGRFLMNAMLASGGYPWTVVPLEKRNDCMAALEEASTNQNIAPFTKFLGHLCKRHWMVKRSRRSRAINQ